MLLNKAVIGDCPRLEIVQDKRFSRIRRLSKVGDCPGLEAIHYRRLSKGF